MSSTEGNWLGPLDLGPGTPTRVMAVVNASPESFYSGSVAAEAQSVRDAAERAAEAGADLLDIGAMSTAPYKETFIEPAEEADRMGAAVAAARAATSLPISADTQRAIVARVALEAGASILNDVSGFGHDPEIAPLVAKSQAGCVLMANEAQLPPGWRGEPLDTLRKLLGEALKRALAAGVARNRIVLDPGVGFFRNQARDWVQWDLEQLRLLRQIGQELGLPLLVGASRKSFIGKVLGRPNAADRLAGSLAVAVWSHVQGAKIVRTHDPKETRDALRMWEAMEEVKNHGDREARRR